MDALAIAGSALQAQQINLGIIADNIANSETPGYQPQQARFISTSPGVAVGAIIGSPQSGSDIGGQLVDLLFARLAYEAAAKVAGTSQQMTQSLLQSI